MNDTTCIYANQSQYEMRTGLEVLLTVQYIVSRDGLGPSSYSVPKVSAKTVSIDWS